MKPFFPLILWIVLTACIIRWRRSAFARFVIITGLIGTNVACRKEQPPTITETDSATVSTALFSRPEWGAFRSFWNELSAIDTSGEFYGGAGDYSAYQNASDRLLVLESNMAKLAEEGYLTETEWKTLRVVTRRRLRYVYFGNTSVLTRMLPTLTIMYSEDLAAVLEKRIDVLTELRSSGKLEDDLADEANLLILDTFLPLAVVETVASNYAGYYFDGSGNIYTSDYDPVAQFDEYLAAFETHYSNITARLRAGELKEYAENYAGLNEKYVETKTLITELTQSRERFLGLLIDLNSEEN